MERTKDMLADNRTEGEYQSDYNNMLAEWQYADWQKSEQEHSSTTDVGDEGEIEFTPEQIEYIKDNLLSDSDLEYLGFNKPIVNPEEKVFDKELKIDPEELFSKIDESFRDYGFLFEENFLKTKNPLQNYYETKDEFNARKNKKWQENELSYEILLERKIIRDKFFNDESDKNKLINKIISEDALIESAINSNRLMVTHNKNLVIPLKKLNLIKSSIIFAKILIHEYIYNEDHNLADESIEQYKEEKLRIQKISDTLQKLNHSFIMPYDGVKDIMFILAFAADCLEFAYYEDTMSLDFYDLYFENFSKCKIKKKFREVMGLFVKLNKYYKFYDSKNCRTTIE
jgi:hypothetical protein